MGVTEGDFFSGDPHASERIGPSCSRTQAAVSLAQLVAALKGADMGMLIQLQEKLRPMIARYHGRELLFDWMLLQIKQAIFEDRLVNNWCVGTLLVCLFFLLEGLLLTLSI